MLAQGGGRKGNGKLLEELALTEEQRPKVEAILQEQWEAMQDLRAKGGKRREMRSVVEKTRDQMKQVLTEEQYQKFEASLKERMRKR